MGACGRLSPRTLAGDPEASRLLALVPFGLPEEPPRKNGSPLRHAIAASPEDRIGLWAALPAACTSGDFLAAEGGRQGWARTASPGDANSLADAIVTLCEPAANEKARALARVAAKERTWQRSADTVLGLLDQAPSERPGVIDRQTPGIAAAFARKAIRKLLR